MMTNLPQQIMQKCEQGIGTTTYRTTTPQQSSQERAEEHVRLRRVGGVCIGRRTCRRPTGRTGRNRDAQLQTYVPEQTCRLDMFDTGRGCSLLSETTDVGRDHEDRAPVAEHSPTLHHMTLYSRTMCTVGPMSPRLHIGAKILAAQLLTVFDCCSNMTVAGPHTARITSVAARSYPHIIQNTSRMWPSSS